MFEDERINIQKGKSYRKGIFLATIISLLYLVLKSNPFSFVNIISEVVIVLSGLGVLLFGELRMIKVEKDERYYQQKYVFYIKGAKIYLILCLLGFACAVPFELYFKNSQTPLNYLLINLEVIGLIFFSYEFKKEEIHFNYAFLENDAKTYYKYVFKNIFKLSYLIGIVYAVSFFIGCFLFLNNFAYFLTIGISFLISWLSLSFDYLFISMMEKISYRENNQSKFSLSIFISYLFFMLFNVIVVILYFKMISVVKGNNPEGQFMGTMIGLYTTYINNCNYFVYAIGGIILSYVLYETHNSAICKEGITIAITTLIIKILALMYRSFVTQFFMHKDDMLIRITDVFLILEFLMSIIILGGIFVLELGLVKEKRHQKFMIIMPIISIIYIIGLALLVNYISLTHEIYLFVNALGHFILYFGVGLELCFVKEKKNEEEISINEI